MFANNEKNSPIETRPMIMVIEDSPDQSAYLNYILSLHEYQVLQIRDPQKALQLMKRGYRPDVILTDIKMPSMTGFELMKKLQTLQIEVPTIIISGIENEQAFERAFVLGAEDYFVKPFSPLSLLSRLSKILLSRMPC